MCQEDDRKSTGVKAACKMMMKLTPRFISWGGHSHSLLTFAEKEKLLPQS